MPLIGSFVFLSSVQRLKNEDWRVDEEQWLVKRPLVSRNTLLFGSLFSLEIRNTEEF